MDSENEKNHDHKMLAIGDIMQIHPRVENWGGLLMCVTEPKSWGAQGFLYMIEIMHACRYNGIAYVRIEHENLIPVGKLTYLPEFLLKIDEENNDN